jgi:hypothetical protein
MPGRTGGQSLAYYVVAFQGNNAADQGRLAAMPG